MGGSSDQRQLIFTRMIPMKLQIAHDQMNVHRDGDDQHEGEKIG